MKSRQTVKAAYLLVQTGGTTGAGTGAGAGAGTGAGANAKAGAGAGTLDMSGMIGIIGRSPASLEGARAGAAALAAATGAALGCTRQMAISHSVARRNALLPGMDSIQ